MKNFNDLNPDFTFRSDAEVICIGTPVITAEVDRDKRPYFRVNLLNPQTPVPCTMDKEFNGTVWDHAYIRESDVLLIQKTSPIEDVDDKDPKKGWFIKGWKVDLSTSHGFPLYSDKTIREWTIGKNGEERTDRRSKLRTELQAAGRMVVDGEKPTVTADENNATNNGRRPRKRRTTTGS